MEQRGIRTERGDINRAIKKANEEINKINSAILKLESELQQIISEQQQEETHQKQDIPTPTQKATETDTTKKSTAQTATTAQAKTISAQPPKPHPIIKPVQSPKDENKPTQSPKITTQAKPVQKPKTLKQVDKEIEIVETKLQRLEHASTVIMRYNQGIEDIQRNLHTVGWWERRKMQKEISTEEQRRDSYEAETTKKYGTKPKLEKEKSKLLAEKKQIEDATGVTAAKERAIQQKRNEVIQRQQDRDRQNAERKAKRLANPSKGKNEPSL